MPTKNTSPQIFFALSFLLLLSNGLNGVIYQPIDINWDLDFYRFLCSVFIKSTQTFDSMKPSVIWKLTYKVKYISQINGALIMFFRNSRIKFP